MKKGEIREIGNGYEKVYLSIYIFFFINIYFGPRKLYD
ncbi:hypothetical protein LEP1GSC172_3983 [Leptospira noguchii]|uniref:Uncharacterized protein n=2 Tax=Leptospira noguchii TaxID=28182 RepID=T0FJ44_9LEPT|nr:hypothetical protein LEP1GSC172_3983 [Leptospira noguchii]EQA73413.1 hypothetical protein LEP1GSC059_0298 [Leptospira noguchii serovar Panama str. CZ214]